VGVTPEEEVQHLRAVLEQIQSPSTSCQQERDGGAGGCGTCGLCCQELREERDALQQQVKDWKMRWHRQHRATLSWMARYQRVTWHIRGVLKRASDGLSNDQLS
jgi:hypothetical protein